MTRRRCVALAAAAVLAGLLPDAPMALPAAATGSLKPWPGPAPAFVLDDLRGDARSLDVHRGKVVLVHFFATWCAPCVAELTSLNALARQARDKPLAILAVDVGEVDLRVRAFFEKLPVDFTVLLDRDRAVAKAWGVSSLPSTFVLTADLAPRFVVETDLDWTQPALAHALDALYPPRLHGSRERAATDAARPTP